MLEDQIWESLIRRPGLSDKSVMIRDMIADSITDIRNFLNYTEAEDLPVGCAAAIKELTLIRLNRDGTEGIVTESQSFGGSTTYSDAIPERVKRTIMRYRRLPR